MLVPDMDATKPAFVDGAKIVEAVKPIATDDTEAMMNAIEVGIRAFDPCLSCATHAFGQMPLIVTVLDSAGNVLNERVR